jgi:chaperonin GroEL (HSP60 family)
VEEVALSGKKIVVVHGTASSPISTLLIAGAPEPSATAQKRETETVLGSLFTTIESGRVVPGGGATEAGASRFLKGRALSFGSKKQLAYGAFAEALMAIPRNLAATTGVPFFRYLPGLESFEQGTATGIDVRTKSLSDMYKKGVIDPLPTILGYIGRAAAFAALIINTDYTLRAKQPKAEKEAKLKGDADDSRGRAFSEPCGYEHGNAMPS